MIPVKNTLSRTVKVAINQWGSTGKTSYFEIEPGCTKTWDRKDIRGFVLCIDSEKDRFIVDAILNNAYVIKEEEATIILTKDPIYESDLAHFSPIPETVG